VVELRSTPDQPHEGDQPVRRARETGTDPWWRREVVEPRTRSEYAADLKQQVVAGTPDRPFGERLDEPLDVAPRGPDSVEGSGDAPETPREGLKRFDPERSGLPRVSESDARNYIEARHADHPWLAAARDCSPEAQRVFAALDQGGGHAHIRHEGWVTEEMNERRVMYLEDPAQLDPVKRAASIDGAMTGDQPHGCKKAASRITEPDAFAVAFTRGMEHPGVRTALETSFDPDRRPRPVSVPVESLLGSDGHDYCTGWQMQPVDGSMRKAFREREAWVAARADGERGEVPQPIAEPVETFEGGSIVFAFGPNRAGDGYEVVTMFPRPPESD
jgi:hypothetical protein